MEEMMTYSDIVSLGGKYKSTTPSNTSECPTKSEVESTFTNVTVGGGVASNELVSVTIYEFYWKNESSTQHNLLFSSLAQSGQITNLISTMNGKFLGYTTSNIPSWFHLTISSTSTTMSYTVDANTLTNMREGTITLTLKDSGKQLKIHVRLEAKEIETSYNFYFTDGSTKLKSMYANPDGLTLSVGITSETTPSGVKVPFTWQEQSTSLLTIANTEDGVSIVVPKNNTPGDRTFTVVFTQTASSDTITLTITQLKQTSVMNAKFFVKEGTDSELREYNLGKLETNNPKIIHIISCDLTDNRALQPILENEGQWSQGLVVTVVIGNAQNESGTHVWSYDCTITKTADIQDGMGGTIHLRQSETNNYLNLTYTT